MTEIELAMMHYDGDGSKPYCDLVWEALKEKRDRERGCDFCKRYLQGIEDVEVTGSLSRSLLDPLLPITTVVKAKYCPKCGRKIED